MVVFVKIKVKLDVLVLLISKPLALKLIRSLDGGYRGDDVP